MATLTGALVAVWIAVCILLAIFLSVLALSGLTCTVIDSGVPRLEAFSGFVCCTLLAGLFYIHVHHLVTKPQETPEPPKTRDILLTVPEKVQVHTEFRLDNTVIGKEVL